MVMVESILEGRKRMRIIVVDRDYPGLECVGEGDMDFFRDMLMVFTEKDIVEEYFVNVSDETWEVFNEQDAKRVFTKVEELEKYFNWDTYIFVYKNGRVKWCQPL